MGAFGWWWDRKCCRGGPDDWAQSEAEGHPNDQNPQTEPGSRTVISDGPPAGAVEGAMDAGPGTERRIVDETPKSTWDVSDQEGTG